MKSQKILRLAFAFAIIATMIAPSAGRSQTSIGAPATEAQATTDAQATDVIAKTFARLDYGKMDAKGMPHKLIETEVRECVSRALAKNAGPDVVESYCACSGNGIVDQFTAREFEELDTTLAMKMTPDPELQQKLVAVVTDCRPK